MVEINLAQANELIELFGGDAECTLFLVEGDESFYAGPGLYARDDYDEDGYFFLGLND